MSQPYNAQSKEDKNPKETICSLHFWHTCDKVTGNQTYTDNADPKQGYNHAKFERSCFNGAWEKSPH